jgi:hypothetical protein
VGRLEATGMAYRTGVFGGNSASTCASLSDGHCKTDWNIALVRWPHPRGLPTTSTALAEIGGTREDFGRELMTLSWGYQHSVWGLFPCDGSHALQPCIAARVQFNLSLTEYPLCLQLEEECFSASGSKTNKSPNRPE